MRLESRNMADDCRSIFHRVASVDGDDMYSLGIFNLYILHISYITSLLIQQSIIHHLYFDSKMVARYDEPGNLKLHVPSA